ncbi:MAG TPA: hypothetical protein VNH80_10800, partial [Burkholderiales bacterium]|nr:hypothetical protein [Burkholderiales bacterium]
RFWEEFSSRKIFERLQERSEAPDNFFDLFAESIREASPQELQEELDVALAERSGFTDTHPALTDRLAALGEAASLAPVEVNAVSVLGDGAASLVAEFNRRWNQRERTSWSLGHFRMKHIAGLLVDADAALAARWNVEKRLARARVLRWLRPAIGLQELRSLRDEHPTHTLVLFSYGSALLNEDDSAGVEIVRSVAKQNPILRVPAYSRLLAYFDRKGDFAEIERWSTLARRAYQRQNRAVHDFVADVQSGRVAGTSLPEDARAVLGEAVTADPCVKRSWLFSGVARLPTPDGSAAQTLVHALVLCLDPEVVKSSGQEEDMVRNRYEDALYSLIWPGEIAVVMSHFTTEIAPQGCRPELAMERK